MRRSAFGSSPKGSSHALGALFLLALGCAPAAEQQAPEDPVDSATVGAPIPRHFSFSSIDGSVVSDASVRGRMTVVALVATYDAPSQAQARFVDEVRRRHQPRVNAVLLVLEPPQNLPMVQAFAASLELAFPVAMADPATVAGKGPFPGLHHVPSVVILDRQAREVWRKLGLVRVEEIVLALRRLD